MNLLTTPEGNLQPAAKRSRVFRLLLVTTGVFAFLYLLLCTYLWNIVYGIFFAFMTNNAPNAKAASSPWCEPGDWVLETFQPMISDEKMIDHYLKNKEIMTQAADLAARKLDTNREGWTREFRQLLEKADLENVGRAGGWAAQPYSVDAVANSDSEFKRCVEQTPSINERGKCAKSSIFRVISTPNFGKTRAQYFCNEQRNSFKQYLYFPGGLPQVKDGQLMDALWYSPWGQGYESRVMGKLVRSTDGDTRGHAYRQIDERWFISRD